MQQLMSDLDGEPRFPNSTQPCKSYQAILLEKIDHICLFFFTSNKGSD